MINNVIYRLPVESDAQNIVDFYNRVGGETTYLSFGENEYPLSVEAQIASIHSTSAQDNAVMILALVDDSIVGIGTISSNQKTKSKHNGELGIVVECKHQGMGIGKHIMGWLIDWCKGNGVTKRIFLEARSDNELAIKLYEKCGFVLEGKMMNQTLIDGTYYHLCAMALML